MARIKITEEEDWRLTHGTKRGLGLSIYGIVTTSVISAFVILGLLLHQYSFAAFVLVLVGLFAWPSRFGLRFVVRRRHFLNRFWREELHVEFSERVFTVTLGLNKLTLAVADLDSLSERDGFYFLSHDSGLNLVIPEKALTTEESVHLRNYGMLVELKNREERLRRSWLAHRLVSRSRHK